MDFSVVGVFSLLVATASHSHCRRRHHSSEASSRTVFYLVKFYSTSEHTIQQIIEFRRCKMKKICYKRNENNKRMYISLNSTLTYFFHRNAIIFNLSRSARVCV